MFKSIFKAKAEVKNNKVREALLLQNKNYFWNPSSGSPNIGDFLAFETVNFLLNLNDNHPKDIDHGKILSIGSVLHFANTNDVIWGTGRNGKIDDNMHGFSNLDVRAVRGPLTKKYLESKGVKVPNIFGDPGILAPLIYPKKLLQGIGKSKSKDLIIVPQINDNLSTYEGHSELLLSPKQLPANFIAEIISAKKVIASSLHGIILAEAYGIPAVYFDSGSGENIFKYNDYYAGTGRNKFAIGSSIEECLDLYTPPIEDLEDRRNSLISCFPFDRYK